MREIERDGDARHAVGREPFVGQPVVGPKFQRRAQSSSACDPRNPCFEIRAFNRDPEVARTRTSSSFSSGQEAHSGSDIVKQETRSHATAGGSSLPGRVSFVGVRDFE